MQGPCGFGKTLTAAHIIRSAVSKGKRVIFTVPRINLVDQALNDFHDEGLTEVGVIQANHPATDPSQPVQICSLQSLERREIPKADLVLIDEAHETRKIVVRWMGLPEWEKVPFIGLSATPWAAGLGKLYTDLIIAATTSELIDKGYLSPFRVWAPLKADVSGVGTLAGDYQEDQLAEVMQAPQIVGDVVSTWLQLGANEPTLAFCVNRSHAQLLQAEFERHGVRAGYVDYLSDRNAVKAVGDALASGLIKVVCNVDKLTTGIDWDVRCIINARPTKSEMRYVQAIGRGLRTAPGKQFCRILEHSDTTERLGFVTDIHHDTLSIGKRKESSASERKKPLPKCCPSCGYVRDKGPSCPACGHTVRLRADVDVIDGDLVEMASATKKKAGKAELTMAQKAVLYGELKAYARSRGFKEGWASNQYKAKVGAWPNHPSIKYGPEREPSMATLSWIRSRQIAWAKRKSHAA